MNTAEVNALVRERLVHEIHTSERKSFRGCRRRWKWIFKDYYYPKMTAKPLEFGVAFHNAMETLYTPETWKMDRDVVMNAAIQVFIDTCNEQKERYLKNKELYTLEAAGQDEEDYEERIELGKGMLRYFAKDKMPEWDKNWTPRKVEVEFIAPIQNPDTGEYLFCKCVTCQRTIDTYAEQNENGVYDITTLREQGLPVALAGRIDAIMEDARGNLWIVDWKTAGQMSGTNDEFLYLDDQISSYVMALRRKLNVDIKGFLYVELRKAVPEPPQENKSRRLGRLYSVSKNQATNEEIYRKTVSENDTEAYENGLYDDFLTFLHEEGTVYAHRYQIMKTDDELEQIERTLFAEASDMVDENLRIYPNSGKFNCGWCAFRQPCLEVNRRGDHLFLLEELFDKRTKHYWVKELSTDKQGGE